MEKEIQMRPARTVGKTINMEIHLGDPEEGVAREIRVKQDFTKREVKLIRACLNYAQGDASGLPGHSLMLIIAKFALLTGLNEVV